MSVDELPEAQRERIIGVATELFSKRGYQETPIELLIARAKVGYASFYKYFGDKEGCFLAILDATLEEARERLRAAYSEGEGPWAERVAAAIAALYELLAENPARSRVCLVEALSAGPAVGARHEAAVTELGGMLLPGRAERQDGERLPDTLETTLAGGIVWIAYQLLVIGEADRLPAQVPEAVQFALSPYLGEEAAVRAAAAAGA